MWQIILAEPVNIMSFADQAFHNYWVREEIFSHAETNRLLRNIDRNKNTRKWALRCIIWAEILAVATTLTLYSLYAFRWSNLGETIATTFDELTAGQVIWITFGGIFWGVVYFFGLFMVWYIHSESTNLFYNILVSVAHVTYHAIRWPIFARMVLESSHTVDASASTSSSTSSSSSTSLVSGSLVILAVWIDVLIVVGVYIFGGIGYGIIDRWLRRPFDNFLDWFPPTRGLQRVIVPMV